jgi:RNA polymerase sigma-70 factor (ECF subfamily)
MAEDSDLELWQRVQLGDTAAFALLFERYVRDVYNFTFRRTGSWDTAEETTSAVFLEAWRRRREVVPELETLRPWLLGVAGNLLRNHSRSLRRHEAAEVRMQIEISPDFVDDLASKMDDEALMRRTLEVFDDLAVAEQDVLGLTAWEGLTYEEIAIALGIPVGTVRSRISRARQHLKELLELRGHGGVADAAAPNPDREGTPR